MQVSTIALLFSLWVGVAAIVSLSIGVALGEWSAAPKPVPVRARRPREIMAERDYCEVGCGINR